MFKYLGFFNLFLMHLSSRVAPLILNQSSPNQLIWEIHLSSLHSSPLCFPSLECSLCVLCFISFHRWSVLDYFYNVYIFGFSVTEIKVVFCLLHFLAFESSIWVLNLAHSDTISSFISKTTNSEILRTFCSLKMRLDRQCSVSTLWTVYYDNFAVCFKNLA